MMLFDLTKSHVLRMAGACLLLAVCVSCASRPPEIANPTDLPEAFSASGQATNRPRWWESFRDPAVTGLVESALDGNFSLKSAWDRLDQARAVARKAGAERYPQLDGSASGGRTARETNLAGRDYEDEFTLGLTASYEVDVWGRVRATHDAAVLRREASREDLRAAAISLSAQVASTWYRLVEQRSQLKLLDRQIATNERYLELVELRFRKGDVSAIDVLQQRKLVESTRTEKARVQAELENLRHLLAVLIGDPPTKTGLPEKVTFPELPELPETGLPAVWMTQRPDIRSAYLRVRASDRDMATAIADQYPRFSITARGQSTAVEPGALLEEWVLSLAGNMTAPLIDGDRRNAEVDRSRAAASESFHVYGQTLLESFQEVEDALTNERQQQKTVRGVRQQLDLSNRTVEQLLRRYRNGTVNFLRVLDELRTQQQLQRTLVGARAQLVLDRIDLHRALGGGWDLDRPADVPAEFVRKEK